MGKWLFALLLGFLSFFDILAAVGHATEWQMGLPEPATPVMHKINEMHNLILWVIAGIGGLVMTLVGYVIWRFREKKNPIPATFTHNVKLEVLWTLIPVLILIGISFPTFKMLYFMERAEKADMTLKVTGHQWYWSYEYPDHGNIHFDSYIVEEKNLKPGDLRLLTVDKPVIVPVGKAVRVILTSDDVLHSWAVPSFGIKTDTVPGKLNETWFRVEKEGVYYGQCSELCGPGHGFMPIMVKAVPESEFEAWVASNKEKTQEPLKRVAADSEPAKAPAQSPQKEVSHTPQKEDEKKEKETPPRQGASPSSEKK